MGKIENRDIYEIKPWLNDDKQNVTRLNAIVNGGGSDIEVEAVTFTENGTFTAPSGKAYSPVTVNVAGGSSDFTVATVTLNFTPPAGISLGAFGLRGVYLDYPDEDHGYAATVLVADENNNVSVILYNNNAIADRIFAADSEFDYVMSGEPTTTGGVTYDNGAFIITGDGSITATLIAS